MALNGDTLGLAIKAAIDGLSDSDKSNRNKVFKAMGNAIVDHITTNAQVTVYVAATDVELQTYVVPPAAAVPTAGNPALAVPVALKTKGTIS